MKQAQDEFAKVLRDDAAREMPEFSGAIHTRVMANVRRERIRTAKPDSSKRLLFIPLGTGVAMIVAVVVWMNVPAGSPAPRVELPTVSSLDQVIREKAAPMREEFEKARFAYLDRDGKRLAKFLWHSVPGVPRERKNDVGAL